MSETILFWMIFGCMVVFVALMCWLHIIRKRSYRSVGAALCEPGFRIRWYAHGPVLQGKVKGHEIRYLVIGPVWKGWTCETYLEVRANVRKKLAARPFENPKRYDENLRGVLEICSKVPRVQVVTVDPSHGMAWEWLCHILIGTVIGPSVSVWRYSRLPFDADSVRQDFKQLLEVVRQCA